MFIWLRARLCLLFAVGVASEAKISSNVLVLVVLLSLDSCGELLNGV